MIAVQPAFYAELFGARVRYTGFATSRELGAAIAGFSPLVVDLAAGRQRRQAVAGGGVLRRPVADLAGRVPVLASRPRTSTWTRSTRPRTSSSRASPTEPRELAMQPVRLGLQALGRGRGAAGRPAGPGGRHRPPRPGRVPPRAPGRLHRGRAGGGAGPWGICGASRRSRGGGRRADASRTGSTACSSAGPRRTACAWSGVVREALRGRRASRTRCATGWRRRRPTSSRSRSPRRRVRAPASGAGWAMLVRGLEARRAAGVDSPLAIVSCDNLPRNGEVLRGLVADAARADDARGLDRRPRRLPVAPWSTASCRPPRRRPRHARAG